MEGGQQWEARQASAISRVWLDLGDELDATLPVATPSSSSPQCLPLDAAAAEQRSTFCSAISSEATES